VAALAAALPGGLLLGLIGWVSALPAAALGLVVGSAAFVASRRHRDAGIQGVAGAAALLGFLLAAVVVAIRSAPAGGGVAQALLVLSYQDLILPALLAIAGAIARFFF